MNVRNILVTLIEMKEHCTRVKVHTKTIFKAAITNLWGSPRGWRTYIVGTTLKIK